MDELSRLPAIPRDQEGPVFKEAWEAQAFALVLALHEQGQMSWKEWTERLGRELATAPASNGSDYYLHWLTALEKLVKEHGIVSSRDLAIRKAEWAEAARRTPHGQPIELPKG